MLNLDLNSQEKFTPEKVADVIASHVTDPELKKLVCNQLVDRLQLMCSTFPCDPLSAGVDLTPLAHCPATTVRGTTPCHALPPR